MKKCIKCQTLLPDNNPDLYCNECYPYDRACDMYKQMLEKYGQDWRWARWGRKIL